MKAANLETSDRLKRVDNLLAGGAVYTTLDISLLAKVCAVSACISELRANGRTIDSKRKDGIWYYRMVS